MAASFFRSSSKRAALCAALSALLLWNSIAAATITKTQNGITYTKLDGKITWTQANSSCPQGLLWLENRAELKWVIDSFLLGPSGHIWLAAKGQGKKWSNGKPLPSDIEIGAGENTCARVDVNDLEVEWEACNQFHHAICKPLAVPSCSRSSSASSFRAIAADRRQSGSELQWITEPSAIACSARCLGDSACCAFEFRAVSGRCRLFLAARAELWDPEEGAQIFVLEG